MTMLQRAPSVQREGSVCSKGISSAGMFLERGMEKSGGLRVSAFCFFCFPSWGAEGLFPAFLPSDFEEG